MKTRVVQDTPTTYSADALLVLMLESSLSENLEAVRNLDVALKGMIAELIASGDVSGKTGEMVVLYTQSMLPAKRLILVGLGKAEEYTVEILRRAAAQGLQKARSLKLNQVGITITGLSKFSIAETAQAVVEGGLLGLYQWHGQKSSEPPSALPEKFDLLVTNKDEQKEAKNGLAVGTAFAEGTKVARDLVNLPPNYCTPSYMADQAEAVGKAHKLKVTILKKRQIEALKMGALLAVAQGSKTEPRFIVMEHNADKANEGKTVVLVGKGVTFDTGGYSIKTSEGMVGMKADMGGGAAVIGAMQTIAMLDLPLHVVGLIPAADNMISGDAYRPQEVITASNGKTIEIISTDAEGRMLLADALVYAKHYNPAAVVDIATLTGAIVIALGSGASGLFGTDDTLLKTLQAAGDATQERVWHMPMFAEYNKLIESDTADMKNSAGFGSRGAGASIGAVFLKNFVDYPAWAHVDMAGKMTSDGDVAYVPKGATGYGARLLAEFVRQWSAK